MTNHHLAYTFVALNLKLNDAICLIAVTRYLLRNDTQIHKLLLPLAVLSWLFESILQNLLSFLQLSCFHCFLVGLLSNLVQFLLPLFLF